MKILFIVAAMFILGGCEYDANKELERNTQKQIEMAKKVVECDAKGGVPVFIMDYSYDHCKYKEGK
jgi:uncharacterized lipoprotein YajG